MKKNIYGFLRVVWRKYLASRLNLRVHRTRRNYSRKLRSLSRMGSAKVMFLVTETAKWKLQSVYDAMVKNPKFEPFIGLTISDVDTHLSEEGKQGKIASNAEFFNARNMKTVVAYRPNVGAVSLEEFSPDIVFYQTPWDVASTQSPLEVSNYALTCYAPYYVPTYIRDIERLFCLIFHRYLFRHYQFSTEVVDYFQRSEKACVPMAGKIVAAGHPMIDEIVKRCKDSHNGECVIYAPHWSLNLPSYPNDFNLSTFTDTSSVILEYAKSHPEVRWVFKPHPSLRQALKDSRFMTEEEIDAYYRAWEEIGEAVYTGDYLDLFSRSRLMITDCDSFLAEYGCTGKPIINLIGKGYGTNFSPFEVLFKTYYRVENATQIPEMFDRLILKRDDFRREERLAALEECGIRDAPSATRIVADLEGVWNGAH